MSFAKLVGSLCCHADRGGEIGGSVAEVVECLALFGGSVAFMGKVRENRLCI